jgi:hypothetical protein
MFGPRQAGSSQIQQATYSDGPGFIGYTFNNVVEYVTPQLYVAGKVVACSVWQVRTYRSSYTHTAAESHRCTCTAAALQEHRVNQYWMCWVAWSAAALRAA